LGAPCRIWSAGNGEKDRRGGFARLDYTQNAINKTLVAIPTAITGFYGQNVPYPGFQQECEFLCSILLVGGGLYLLFKRKDWL
jgi:hypothetical protein